MSEYVFRTDEPIKRCFGFSNGVGECPLVYSCNVYKQTDVETKEKNAVWINRLPNCPLKELLPHGRLIDVDKFIDIIKHEYSHDFICENDVELLFSLLKDEASTVIEASRGIRR